MSWSFTATVGVEEDFEDAMNASYEQYKASNYPNGVPGEVDEQVETAISAALMLVDTTYADSTELPRSTVTRISLHGHANPLHEPLGGWSHDSVGLSINRSVPQ